MFTFGFLTTSTPYLLLGLGYLFYFVTAMVDQDLADKWFFIVAPIEVCSDDHLVEQEDCIDYYNVADNLPQHPVYIPAFASTPIAPTGEPQVAFIAISLAAPSLSRPPNV